MGATATELPPSDKVHAAVSGKFRVCSAHGLKSDGQSGRAWACQRKREIVVRRSSPRSQRQQLYAI